jgi:hypothetical protein
VRKDEHPAAEALQQLARLGVEFENGVLGFSGAAIAAAALGDPDVAFGIDIDAWSGTDWDNCWGPEYWTRPTLAWRRSRSRLRQESIGFDW